MDVKGREGFGFEVFGFRIESSEAMGKYSSIFQEEIHRMERCLQININRRYSNQDNVILSGGQDKIKSLNFPVVSSKMVCES